MPIRGTVTGAETGVDETAPGCDADVVPPLWRFFSSGTGTVSHLGRVDYHPTKCSYPGPEGVVSRNGTIAFTADNGDTLVIAQEGSSEVIGDFDGYTLTATWTRRRRDRALRRRDGLRHAGWRGRHPRRRGAGRPPRGGIRFSIAGGNAYDDSTRAR
jgi:hypothetical protein